MVRRISTETRQEFSTLQVRDHTKIVEFILTNRNALRAGIEQPNSLEILQRASVLAKGNKAEATLFTNAVSAVRRFNEALKKIPNAEWQKALPLVTRLTHARDMAQLRSILRAEGNKKKISPALRVGIKIASQMLDEGSKTIYNPEFVVATIMWDPRQGIGQIESTVNKVKDKAVEIATADVAGAIAGALAGAATGGLKGAAKGAVEGAIANSTMEAS